MDTLTPRFSHIPHGRFIIRVALVALVFLVSIVALSLFDQWRTDTDMGPVLSGFFSNYALSDLQYWGPDRKIQIILLREAQNGWKTNEFRRSFLLDRRLSFPQASSFTRSSFILSNVFPINIKAELVLPNRAQFSFLSRKDLEGLTESGFQKRFPDNWGYFVISHVGLNSNKTEAILYLDRFGGGLSGGGSCFLMRKVDGSWRVVDHHVIWMP